ncbi:hypothetical protein SmJEL517_g00708 [Synchytrium microbalum]|uniref:non-specific serine/threonine protein kinase n=1 Tax=Synchytrium microbalum TaxID=1806994 RepID=A0A507C8V2_9FUNG|nr:uncharacterized protein SmJEL517_g00708 [Synchytrium microbalum]TPX37487.1 hypothetical protein SmJEL517_g00708 [Synchytrium microbalum]
MSYGGRKHRDARRAAPRYASQSQQQQQQYPSGYMMEAHVAVPATSTSSRREQRHQEYNPMNSNVTMSSPNTSYTDTDPVFSAKVGRAQSLLARIFKDQDDASFSKRIAAAGQLEKLISGMAEETGRDVGVSTARWSAETAREYLLTLKNQNNQPIREIVSVLQDSSASIPLKQAVARCISATGIAFRADILPFYDWIFNKLKYVSARGAEKEKDLVTYLLIALREVVQFGSIVKEQGETVAAFSYPLQAERLLEHIPSFLDAMETQDYLPKVLDVLHVIADRYPAAFQVAFEDVADRLVGWHIDETVTKTICSLLGDSFKKFWPFWRSKPEFELDLLSRLITDIEAEGEAESDRLPSRAMILLRCFHSIFTVLCFSFFPSVNPLLPSEPQLDPKTDEQISIIVHQMLDVLFRFNNKYTDKAWVGMSVDLIKLLSRAYEGTTRMAQLQKIAFDCMEVQVRMLLDTYDGPPEDLVVDATSGWKEISEGVNTWLEIISEVFSLWGTDLNPLIVSAFIHPKSIQLGRLRVRCSGEAKTLSRLLALCRKCIALSVNNGSADLVSGTALVEELVQLLQYLLDRDDPSILESEIERGLPEVVRGLKVTCIQALVAFDSLLVTEATIKGMTGFEIPAVALTMVELTEVLCSRPPSGWVLRAIAVMFWCLHEICASFGYFSSSMPDLLQRSFQLMCTYLAPGPCSLDLRRIALTWFIGVVAAIPDHMELAKDWRVILDQAAFNCLELGDQDLNGEIREAALKLWNGYLSIFTLSKGQPRVMETLMKRLQDTNDSVRTQSFAALISLDAISTMTMSEENAWHEGVSSLKMQITKSPLVGTFRTRHFSTIAWYMGLAPLNPPPEEAEDLTPGWRERIFHASQSENALKTLPGLDYAKKITPDAENLLDRIHFNDALLSYWSGWEVARYCITARLRTPYGTPPQTFDAIEHALTGLVKSAEGLESGDTPIDMSSAILSRLRELLTFLDALEVQIHNAAEGSGLHLALAPRTSAAFFHANRRVCDEWFQRLRGRMLHGARLAGLSVSSVIRQAHFLLGERQATMTKGGLKDWSGWAKDVERGMEDLTTALIASRNADAIAGLVKWSFNAFGSASPAKMVDTSKPPAITIQRRTPDPVIDSRPSDLSFPYLPASVLMAQGNLESAINEFTKTINPIFARYDSTSAGLNFMLQQITECYLQLNDTLGMKDWLTQVEEWQSMLEDDGQHGLAAARSVEYLRLWATDLVGNHNNTIKSPPPPPFQFNRLVDVGLHQATADALDDYVLSRLHGHESPKPFRLFSECQHTFEGLVFARKEEVTRIASRAQLVNQIELTLSKTPRPPLTSIGFAEASIEGDKDLQQWTHYVKTVSTLEAVTLEKVGNLADLRLYTARIAHKQHNMNLATRMLSVPLDSPSAALQLRQQFQVAKLQFDQSHHTHALQMILKLLTQPTDDSAIAPLRSKMWRRLAKWGWAGRFDFGSKELQQSLASVIGEYKIDNHQQSDIGSRITQSALEAVIRESPQDYKAWLEIGNFWYRRGRKMLEEAASGRCGGELEPIHQYLRSNAGTDIEKVLGPLVLWELGESADGSAEDAQGTESQSEATVHVQTTLRTGFPDLSSANIDEATLMVLDIRQRVLKYFDSASQSYFTHLQIGANSNRDKENESAVKCNEITVTLRLLRLLVKYGGNLEKTFHNGLNATSLRVWSNIVPQLFARLYHPDRTVQKELGSLVTRIGLEFPSLAVYHAVVGAKSTRFGEGAHIAYTQPLNALKASGSGAVLLVNEVEILTAELQRITVLPEELWLHRLGHLAGDVAKRLERVSKEVGRVMANATLAADEKIRIGKDTYITLLKPVVASVEKLVGETLEGPSETKSPCNISFSEAYGTRLREALEKLRTPSDFENPKRAWDAFNQLYNDLSKHLNRNRTLKLSELSSILSEKRGWVIPIPGHTDTTVHIERFNTEVHVIATKTKPKKIELVGSDGRRYPFLFKGLEDLHLDERVSQFLSTANHLLQRDRQSAIRRLRARHYAVIPLGDHHGMIQWVTNVTPMFAFYKRWQMSSSRVQPQPPPARDPKSYGKDGKGGKDEAAQGPVRPLELFHSKINSALKRHGLSRSSPRGRWPAHMLREVFADLKTETPGNLLERELWFSSPDSISWWEKIAGYNRSLAVMSVIGYIIGLGDRHLDNLLLDVQTGECVHIDYNVCFEKGKRLRVPEIVPFRLTQNLERALGLTGVEGMFRLAAEHTMRVMRQNREVLVTLLEAFVYDPLVDWTQSLEDAQEMRVGELNVNMGLLASRIAEMKAPLDLLKDGILPLVLTATSSVDRLLMIVEQRERVEETIERMKSGVDSGPQEKGTIPLSLQTELHSAQETVIAKAQECAYWRGQHEESLVQLQDPFSLGACAEVMNADVNAMYIGIEPTFVAGVVSNATIKLTQMNSLLHRCAEVNQELVRIAQERVASYRALGEHLQLYHTLVTPILPTLMAQDYFLRMEQILADIFNATRDEDGVMLTYDAFDRAYSTIASALTHGNDEVLQQTVAMDQVLAEYESDLSALAVFVSSWPMDAIAKRVADLRSQIVALMNQLVPKFPRVYTLVRGSILEVLIALGSTALSCLEAKATLPSALLKAVVADSRVSYGIHKVQPDCFPESLLLSFILGPSLQCILDIIQHNDLQLQIDRKSIERLAALASTAQNLADVSWKLSDSTGLLAILQSISNPTVAAGLDVAFDQIGKLLAEYQIDQTPSAHQPNDLAGLVAIGQSLHIEYESILLRIPEVIKQPCTIVLASIESIFAARSVSPREGDSADDSVSTLFPFKLSVMSHLYADCKTFLSTNQVMDLSPTDLLEVVVKNPTFVDTIQALRRYLNLGIREFVLKPIVQHINNLVKNIIDGVDAASTSSDPKPSKKTVDSGVKTEGWFMTAGRKCLTQLLENGAVTKEQVRLLQTLIVEVAAVQVRPHLVREAASRAIRVQRKLQARRIPVWRVKYLNDDSQTDSIRVQFITNFQSAIELLLSHQEAESNVRHMCRALEEDVLKSIDSSMFSKRFQELAQARHQRFAQEHDRDEKFISLLNGLVHLEQHRFSCDSTRKFDDSILQSIRRLQWVTVEVDRVAKLGPGVLLIDQMNQQLQSLSIDDSLRSVREVSSTVLAQLPTAVTLFEDLEAPVMSVVSLAEEFPEAHKILKRLNEFLAEASATKTISSEMVSTPAFFEQAPSLTDLTRRKLLMEQLHTHLESVIVTAMSFSTLEPLDLEKQDVVGGGGNTSVVNGPTGAALDSEKGATATSFDGATSPQRRTQVMGGDNSPLQAATPDGVVTGVDGLKSSSVDLKPANAAIEVSRIKQASRLAIGQERNAHAIHVLKRVRAKLDGRDGSDFRRLGVSEQVDMIITQSTSVDNLASI